MSVDANLAATRDLQANAEAAGVQVVSNNEHTEDFLKKEQETPEFVVLDPPRSGLGADVAARLANLGAAEIAYLSCDPVDVGKRPGGADGVGAKTDKRSGGDASLRD